MVHQKISWDPHSTEEEHEFSTDVPGGDFPEWVHLEVLSDIIHNDKDVLVALGGFQEQPSRSIPSLSKGTTMMGCGMKGVGVGFWGG